MTNIIALENSKRNKIQVQDLGVHDWYHFVLGYPPHLVRYYIEKFGVDKRHIIFDPFCGTGTTVVEGMANGISCYGLEANPMTFFASAVKTYNKYDPEVLYDYLAFIYCSIKISFDSHGISEPREELFCYETRIKPVKVERIEDLSKEQRKLIPSGFICPKPLLKVLIIKEIILQIENKAAREFFLLALASFIVKEAGNVRFGPEVGRTKAKGDIKASLGFVSIAETMINDVEKSNLKGRAQIILGDAREIDRYLSGKRLPKIDCVITSPPYPNEKDYTRSTRLESVLLDYIRNRHDLRKIKEHLLRSNSRNVFVSDRDGEYIRHFARITSIAKQIEKMRLELNKTSGFEKHYHRIVLHYFGGMYRHLKTLKPFLAKSARLAYVVGDQMSFFRVLIPTAELLGEIAESLGYKVKEIELWRTRAATATKMQINENVLILENK